MKKRDYPDANVNTNLVENNSVKDNLNYYETTTNDLDEYLLDTHGHLIVKHDLFNHDNSTQDGIAEAFLEFAKKEKLSFVRGKH